MSGNILLAFVVTFFAGVSTTIGSFIAFLSKGFKSYFLSLTLGFSAGVMIYVSFVEIFRKAQESLTEVLGSTRGYFTATLGFFAGIALIALIDNIIPQYENPHEMRTVESEGYETEKLMRMGLFSALAIAIHNFPEGLATFMATLQNPSLGFAIAIAIAIHNIPEGIAVAVPIFYSTKSKSKAFWLSTLSGFSELIGATIGYLLIRPFVNEMIFGTVFAAVAGIMVYISLDELLPTAEEYGHHHLAIGGLIFGMAVMATSLVMMK